MTESSVLFPVEEQAIFQMAIGQAITQWAHVEHGLYMIAWRCFEPDPSPALASGFYSIENFRSKVAFTRRAFETASFFTKYCSEWQTLASSIEALAKRRNEIAHGRLITYLGAPARRSCALVPTFSDSPKKKSSKNLPPNGSLCVRDIDLAAMQFGRASMRLSSLYYRIGGEEDPFGEHIKTEIKAKTLGQLRNQLYQMTPRRVKK